MWYYFVYPLFFVLGHLPDSWQRGFCRLLYWMLYRVVHYRLNVVRDNLLRSFPEKSEEDRLAIEEKFYRHLSDVFFETILMATIRPKKIQQKFEFINKAQIEEYTAGQSWIAVMAHYGSWEYTTSWGLHSSHDKVLAAYKPLTNKNLDNLFHRIRARFGVEPVAMNHVLREMISCRGQKKNITLALIADQNPHYTSESQVWYDFLGQKTLFFEGADRLARKFSLPVAFLHVDKFEKGDYKAWFEIIYDGKEPIEADEITRRYKEKLEEMIRQRPELWMWSHRRWKHQPPPWVQ